MPELDYALLCDYVRTEGGIAHVIGAGIDTVTIADVPTGANVGVLVRLTFTRNECGSPHRLEIIYQSFDGAHLARVDSVLTPEWNEPLPVQWRQGALIGLNIGLPLPAYGEYALEVMVNDNHMKTLRLRVRLHGRTSDGGRHMRFVYDNEANALDIIIRDECDVVRTVTVDRGTLVDVDEFGEIIAIEVLNPARPWPLTKVLEDWRIDDDAAATLRALWHEPFRYPFADAGELSRRG